MLLSHIQKHVKQRTTISGIVEFTISKDLFYDIIRKALSNVKFDENWYIDRYHDVRIAIKSGDIASAKEHFIKYGYFEGRLPYPIYVDENFYLEENTDVKSGIETGKIKSAAEHFYISGAQEGRFPSRNFSLFEYVADPQLQPLDASAEVRTDRRDEQQDRDSDAEYASDRHPVPSRHNSADQLGRQHVQDSGHNGDSNPYSHRVGVDEPHRAAGQTEDDAVGGLAEGCEPTHEDADREVVGHGRLARPERADRGSL